MLVLSAAAALVVRMATAQSGNDAGSGLDGMMGLLFLVGMGAFVIVMMRSRQPSQVEARTPLPPDEVMQRAIQTYTMNGWRVNSQLANNVTFVTDRKPSCLIALILLCIGFIPGILYLIFAGRSLSASLHVSVNEASMSVVRITSNTTGFGGKSTAERVIASLPRAARQRFP